MAVSESVEKQAPRNTFASAELTARPLALGRGNFPERQNRWSRFAVWQRAPGSDDRCLPRADRQAGRSTASCSQASAAVRHEDSFIACFVRLGLPRGYGSGDR